MRKAVVVTECEIVRYVNGSGREMKMFTFQTQDSQCIRGDQSNGGLRKSGSAHRSADIGWHLPRLMWSIALADSQSIRGDDHQLRRAALSAVRRSKGVLQGRSSLSPTGPIDALPHEDRNGPSHLSLGWSCGKNQRCSGRLTQWWLVEDRRTLLPTAGC